MRETHSPASSDDGKPTSKRARGLRLLQDTDGHFGDHAEQPFGACDHAEQIITRSIEMPAAEAKNFAGDQHDFATEHVVGGHAVFQAMHATGILRHVAADGAGNLRGRIRRVIKSRMRNRVADRKIGDTRLRHHDAVVKIDVADAVELGHAEQHAVRERKRAAGQRGAGPAWHHLDAFVVAIAQHLGDLLGGLRKHDNHRQLAIGGEPVAFVWSQFALRIDHTLAGYNRPQGGDNARPAAQYRLICLRHSHGHGQNSRLILKQRYQPFDALHIGLAKPIGNQSGPAGVGSAAA